jgi:predicted ATPase
VLRFVRGLAMPETGEAYARARELWERLGSPSEFLQVPYLEAAYHAIRGELDQARRLGQDLLDLSSRRGNSGGVVLGHSISGITRLHAGRFAVSRLHLEAVLALYDPISHSALVHQAGTHPLAAQVFLGNALFCQGFVDQGRARINAAISDARRLANPATLAVCLGYSAMQLSLSADNALLGERADELVAVATEQGFPWWRAAGAIFRGGLKTQDGDVASGLSLLRSGLAAYRATGADMWMPRFVALLAQACGIAGQIAEAVTLFDEALQIVERTGEHWFEAELRRHKGQLLLRQGQSDAAEELYRNALSIAREQDAKLWELRAAGDLARLRRDQSHRAEARELLAPIYGWFSEGFDTPDLKEAKALLEELS